MNFTTSSTSHVIPRLFFEKFTKVENRYKKSRIVKSCFLNDRLEMDISVPSLIVFFLHAKFLFSVVQKFLIPVADAFHIPAKFNLPAFV